MIIDDDSWIQSDEEDNFPSTCPDLLWHDLITSGCKYGWLKKKSRGLIKKNLLQKWSYRFFSLNSNKLFYFKSPELKYPNGVIDFDQVRINLTKEENMLILNPCNQSNTFTVKLYNNDELETWHTSLQSVIEGSRGWIEDKTALGKKAKFWKNERISEIEFLNEADTGDLVIVRNENLASKLTRTFHGNAHDTLALVIKYVNGKVALLAGNDKEVASLVMWDKFLLAKAQGPGKVFWRRLTVDKSDEMMMQLEEFVMSLKENQTSLDLSSGTESEGKKHHGSLGSEVIVSAFKEMGIISKDFSAKQYSPEDFSTKKEIILELGATLGRELLLDFEID